MSFLKITDPAKRDLIVAEFLKTKKNIQQNFLNEKLGDIGMQQELTKFYKPIVDSQSTISKEQNALLSTIKENSAATSNALQALPASISSSIKAIKFQQLPSIGEKGDPLEDVRKDLGDIALEYMTLHHEKEKLVDKTHGIYKKDGKWRIGDTIINFRGNDLEVKGKIYVGTPGLWKLLTMKAPTGYGPNDYDNYGEILWVTNAMRRYKDDPNTPNSHRGKKWVIVGPIWEKYTKNKPILEELEEKEGEGVVVLPQDPNALVEMLSLRIASYRAGNTGVRNEIVGISEELLRQGAIDADSYKNLMLQ